MTDRSAEERELARRERERRRAESSQGQAAPAGELAPERGAAAAPEPAVDQDESAHAGDAWLQDDPGDEEDTWLADDPEPLPPPPVSRSDGRRGRRPVPPRAGGTRAGPRPGAQRSGERRRSWGGRALALLAIAAVLVVLWFLVSLFQPFAPTGHGEVTVTIPPHASTSQIAHILDRGGAISCTFPACAFLFELRAKLDGRTLLSGTYHLKQGMSFEDAIGILATPPPAAKTTEVTITPGHPRSYIAGRLAHERVTGNYLNATKRSPALNPRTYGAPAHTPNLEGFLFPDTYQLRVPISIGTLVADQLKDFKRRFKAVSLSHARSRHLTPYDVLIIASLIQNEATRSHDFPLVASVIYNRLRLNMPLQLDSTTRYATGNYSHPITASQLKSSSPWNTHTHAGLPPTPIDSPALSAIQAAARPAQTHYLYFVNRPCNSGALAFAPSYSQQLVNEQRLQQAHGHYSNKC